LQKNRKKELSKILLDAALQKAASTHTLTISQLKKVQPGERRNLHDDISIITIDL
jgi:hypothetical protein